MPEVGVLQLTIKDNSDRAATGLESLSDALVRVKHAVTGGLGLSEVANEVTHLAKVIQEAKGTSAIISKLGTMFNAINKFSSIKQFNINADEIRNMANHMLELADAKDKVNKQMSSNAGVSDWRSNMGAIADSTKQAASTVKESVETLISEEEKAANRKVWEAAFRTQQYSSDMSRGSGGYAAQIKETVDGLVKVESEVQKATTESAQAAAKSMHDVVQNASIDYSKLNLDNFLPQSLADRARFTSDAMNQYKASIDAVIPSLREYRDTALTLESKEDFAGFSKKTGEDFVTHIQEAEREIAKSTASIQEKVQTTAEVVESSVKEGWGTGSIKPLYEDVKFGPALAGLMGVQAQLQMMQQIANATGLSLDEIRNQLIELSHGAVQFGTSIQQATSTAQSGTNGVAAAMRSLSSASSKAIDINKFIESYSHIDYLKKHIEELKSVLAARMKLGLIDRDEVDKSVMEIKKLTEEYNKLIAAQTEAADSSKHLTFNELKKGLKSSFPLLSRLKHQLGNIMIRRGLMAALRTIIAGFKEGTKNVYEYSKAIGSTFHQSMDSAASSIMTMKNSLGAALAPAIQSVIPILQTVVNWFITLINFANQFFALLGGQATWTRALPATTTAFNKQEKAAKGAGAAMKDLLADWDELNIIQSQSGGGGGGGASQAAEDYLNMFEEVNKFDQKIKDIVQGIKDNFDTILNVAEGIGAAILLWKLSRAFGHELGLLQKLELAAGLTLLIEGIKISASAGYDIGKNGINGENAIEAVAGVLGSMLGGGLAGLALGGVTGGLIGLVVGGALSVIVLSANIERGRYDSLYGDLHKDADDIKYELESNILTMDAKATINIAKAQLMSTTQAEGKVTDALHELEKLYPINIQITPDNAEDFKSKVDALVTATNELIGQSKETLKSIYVPATVQFSESFVDDAWGSVEDTVQYLGKKIGEELSKGISDNTRLDDLRKKLMELSATILTAQKQSEFGGSVGILGGAVRSNTKVGNYDRESVANYIKGYNELTETTRADAEAQAKLEYGEASRLVTSLKKSIEIKEDELKNQSLAQKEIDELTRDIEEMKRQLGIAQAELDSWENGERAAQRAKELYDEWTGPGRYLYGQDIHEAVSMAMSRNKNYHGERDIALSEISFLKGQGQDTDEYVKNYIKERNEDLIIAIAEESGMNWNDIKNFVNESGINPLSFFDEDFVREYQSKLVQWLRKSKLTPDQREKVLESLGFSVDEITANEQEKIRNAIYEAARAEENGTVRNASGKIAELKREYGVDAVNEVLQEMEDIFITGDGHVIDDSTLKGLYKHINWSIGSAGFEGGNRYGFQQIVDELYNSGDLEGLRTILDYIEQFGVSEGFANWKQYGPGLGSNQKFVTSQDLETANTYSRFENRPEYGSGINGDEEDIDIRDISGDVEKGVLSANADQNSLLSELIRVCTRIANKDFSIKVAAGADWGFHNNRSNDAAAKVTGDIP